MYCEDLSHRGHTVKLILDGPATSFVNFLANNAPSDSPLAAPLRKLHASHILHGVCKTGSGASLEVSLFALCFVLILSLPEFCSFCF